ncbi:hypothetical protein F5B19DRAFT_495977 [Rostrohypoxylon terebratum]|nr:hypothetical protein F5B19DRAFT_495977 [Rostrohypoxylon terebratum]
MRSLTDMEIPSFWRQTWALTKKNIIIAVYRKWFSTLLRSLVFPLILQVLLLEIQNFAKDDNKYGVGDPHTIPTLAESMAASSKPLVLVQQPGLGSDFAPVLEKITGPLDSNKLIHLNDEDAIDVTCPVDYHGNSPCFAVVIFNDSPLSGHEGATWNYTIRTDPALDSVAFNVYDTKSTTDQVYLPLQSAVENAMLNLTVSPAFLPYTYVTQEQKDDYSRKTYIALSLYLLSFIYYVTFIPVCQHLTSMIASERETGMSALIDAMGGGVAGPRVLSYVLFFYVLYLPLWIIMGVLYWYLLFPGQSVAVTIWWQILTGWATISNTAYSTAYFKHSNVASLYNSLMPWLLAILAAFSENSAANPPPLAQVVSCSLFFPSMNFIYFFDFIAKAEVAGIRVNFMEAIPKALLDTGNGKGTNWTNIVGPYWLWIILAVQIVVYTGCTVLLERFKHGNNRKRRTFSTDQQATDSHIAIEATGLEKLYKPHWFKKLFCFARDPKTKAVDGLDLISQKHQITCLLGPNGSGKTTTLDMLAGFERPTGGSVNFNALPSQIGICPQRNVLWENLTVYEHLQIWNTLKGKDDNPEVLDQLIEKCDLAAKKHSLAKNLSGGMKRKLQLACMLIGDSTVCLMDEVTSGLDPLSRRSIWNVILSERARRTMILTTHFLDECEVLSDHIVIVTLGKVKCQGTPTLLKNQYGGGYRVHIPKTEDISKIEYPVKEHHDRFICQTPDSKSAAAILGSLKNASDSELYITGPTIEDVFLTVSEEPHTLIGETLEIQPTESERSRVKVPPGEIPLWKSYSQQISALFIKRVQILKNNWWAYLFCLAIPLVATHFINDFLKGYQTPDCNSLISFDSFDSRMAVSNEGVLAVGPPAVNSTIMKTIDATNPYHYDIGQGPFVVDTEVNLVKFIHYYAYNISNGGGIWLSNDTIPLIAHDAMTGQAGATSLLNLVNQVRSNQTVAGYTSNLKSYHQAEGGDSVFYVTVFCLLQALYPSFFALYPTYERRSQVRALQYSNGIRPFSLLFSYWMFDFMFVLVISAGCTALIANAAPWFGIGYVWFIQVLYGLAAILFAYLIALLARSQPAAYAYNVLFLGVMYALSIVTLLIVQRTDGANQRTNDGTAFGLGIIFPIQNLMRGMAISLNMYIVRCRGQTMVTNPGSIYAFGGPIMLLILQIIGLFSLLLWIEGGSFAWVKKTKPTPPPSRAGDIEKTLAGRREDVIAETARVTASETDLLRALHVSKSFGQQPAVEDVSLGLREGEILALLGPNGAGKTTMINMIRGDLTPDTGRIYLEGVDVLHHKRLAQRHLGVCPQFDALDLLTVREHLTFYARCKGVEDPHRAVAYVMSRVGITAHAAKPANKLSGGNMRKLSLAIALLGDPPVLLLDEPSSAMDAASKRVLWRTLEAVAPGRSVLITTHSMEEADALATRAAIVAKKVLAVGTTQALRKTHSNEYHVHLILRSAPLSKPEEMQSLEDWARRTFGGAVRFEGESLGGQVRFIVPTDVAVPGRRTSLSGSQSGNSSSSGSSGSETEAEADRIEVVHAIGEYADEKKQAQVAVAAKHGHATQNFTRFLIETLEAQKEALNVESYSISAATMESVFMKVVKESDAVEHEELNRRKWWQW